MPTLTNWNREISFDIPKDNFKTPQQVSDVQAIVRQAAANGQPVTVVGARHSMTECVVGDGVGAMGRVFVALPLVRYARPLGAIHRRERRKIEMSKVADL
jgi:hypothetical protein